jgi:hypothetical protein
MTLEQKSAATMAVDALFTKGFEDLPAIKALAAGWAKVDASSREHFGGEDGAAFVLAEITRRVLSLAGYHTHVVALVHKVTGTVGGFASPGDTPAEALALHDTGIEVCRLATEALASMADAETAAEVAT